MKPEEQVSAWLPRAFRERLQGQFSAEINSLLAAFSDEPAVSVRLNPHKMTPPAALASPVPWCSDGWFLDRRPVFTLDPLIHAGAYYVQEASSMFLEQAVKTLETPHPRLVLDLCGAPGGKSTHLLRLLSPNDFLVSNEVIRSRAVILDENIRKWGHSNVLVCSNDPRDFSQLPGMFDLMVVDAPCSGEGLFRRDQAAAGEWSPANAQLCADRQRRILADV